MSDTTTTEPGPDDLKLDHRPEPTGTPVDYEVHEYMPGEFVWHLYDADAQPVAGWNWGQFGAAAPGTGESTLYGWDGRKIREHTFRTEYEAHQFVRDTFGLPCRTRFGEKHPDPRVQAFIDHDQK